ncbi:MAG: Do family serine endopeptidase [Acidobacteriia bacterium]|nr:Do family serine endopeptidase [Terriglobia bacterium]
MIQGATEILVALADRQEFKAKVIGADPKTDIALLKVDARDLPFLKPADSAAADVGDIVLAIGNPFGVGQTVTMGIVSAVGRGGLGIEAYEDFIQTDAAINPGNSGGALIDTRGALIGINTAILSRAGGNQGVGFAIPANMARDVMDQILKTGKVVRGWLGVSIQPVTGPMARAFGLSEARGALISGVAQDSPAARASLATGDVIVELNGRKITESRDLQLEVGRMRPGAEATMKLIRDGKERSVSVKLGEAPEEREALPAESRKTGVLQGLEVDELTPQVARQLGLSGEVRGVVVVRVDAGSAAAAKGIQRGDVVQQVNRQVVTDLRGFEAAVRRAGDGSVLLLLNRQGRTFFVVLEAN